MDTKRSGFSEFHNVLEQYEKLIQELASEIDVYKAEYEANKSTISTLVKENRELSARLKETLKVVEKNEIIEHIYTENDLIDNLNKQLAALAVEKESVVQLWQTALKTVDYLEQELRLYEGRTHGYVPINEIKKLKTSYELQIETLQKRIRDCNLKIENTKIQCTQELDQRTKLIEKQTDKLTDAQNIINKLELQLNHFEEKVKNLEVARDALQTNLTDKNKQIEEFLVREQLSKSKVREAINVVESALMEKDNALLREAQAREDLAKFRRVYSELVQENEMKANTEINKIKSTYLGKLMHFEESLTTAQKEIQTKNYEIEKQFFQLEILQKQIEFLQTGSSQNKECNINKLLMLEKNLESTFQKLLLSERNNLQLTAERNNIKLDMEQMASQFERDVSFKETEIRKLKMQLGKLEEELERSNGNLEKTVRSLDELNRKYKEMQKKYKLQKGSCQKTLSNAGIRNYRKLKKFYDQQVEISRKWKMEALTIYNNFSKPIIKMRDKYKELKTENYELKDKLLELDSTITKYQQSLEALCVDFETVDR